MRGQACAQKRALFVIAPDSILPAVVSLPPTSLAPFKQYLTALIGKRLPITGVVTKITLRAERNAGGTEYAEAVFSAVGQLSAEECVTLTNFGKMFGAMFRPTPPGAMDFVEHTRQAPAAEVKPPNVPGWTPAQKKASTMSGEEEVG